VKAARTFDDAFPLTERDGRSFVELDGFGGITLGCAVLAVARSVDGPRLHAIHSCFVRTVPTGRPLAIHIEPISDGRRFARRRLEIREDGRLFFQLVASFAAASEGPEFADATKLDLPAPETLPTELEVAAAEGWDAHDDFERLIELRWCGRPFAVTEPAPDSTYHVWVRPCAAPKSGAGRDAGIAYTADFHSHWPVARKLGGSFDTEGFISLDQAVWIHRDDAWDDWWLLSSWTEQGHAGRSLGQRTLRGRDGRLIASMAQESMIPGARLRGPA
jgi:acyl-CoA thioesterase-2